jgi:hypothetical protein
MNPIADIAKGLIGPVSDLLGELITDKDERNRLAHDIAITTATHAHGQLMGQIEVNKTQAQHGSLFVAGARPAIMWICAFALAYNTLIHPIASAWVELPPVDATLLYPVLMGLLGLGGMRSWEKSRGVARNDLKRVPQ